MTEHTPPDQAPETPGLARHGYRNEVNWEGGSGRQPYANQGRQDTPGPASGAEYAQGDRADRSGQNLDQFERAKRKD